MFNIFNQGEYEKGSYEERSHRDFNYRNDLDEYEKQYCRICDKMQYFIWDRCEVCKSN